jgi:hypothetical protein
MSIRKLTLVICAVFALALPSAAVAKKGHGKGHSNNPKVTYVFKGTYNADGSVHVLHGNKHVRKAGLKGTDVTFDYTGAKVVVADSDSSGTADISDVQAGDRVVVKSRLGRRDPGAQPFAVKRVVDQTNPPVEDESETPEA